MPKSLNPAESHLDSVETFFSSLAQKPAPVLDGSGAGLVGNPSQILDFCDTLPAMMTGDAWEAAARHVLAMRQKAPEPCLFPQPPHDKEPYPIGTGQSFVLAGGVLRDGFVSEATIDAPSMLPMGGVKAHSLGLITYASQAVSRTYGKFFP